MSETELRERAKILYGKIDTQKKIAKEATQRVKDYQSELRVLLTESGQTELPLAATTWKCENCGETFAENPGETHAVMGKAEDNEGKPFEYDCGPVKPAEGEAVTEDPEDEEEDEEGVVVIDVVVEEDEPTEGAAAT